MDLKTSPTHEPCHAYREESQESRMAEMEQINKNTDGEDEEEISSDSYPLRDFLSV